jgi:DNA-binding transcriptional LysR family regulator
MLRLNSEFDSVKQLPIELPDSLFPVAIVTLKDRTLTPAVELFLDALRGHIKSLA